MIPPVHNVVLQEPFTDIPDKPGYYWFYGDLYMGSMGEDYYDNAEPDRKLSLVKVIQVSNGLSAVSEGNFVYLKKFDKEKRISGIIGVWYQATIPLTC